MKIVFLSILAATTISSLATSPKKAQPKTYEENVIIENNHHLNRKALVANNNSTGTNDLFCEVEENDSLEDANVLSDSNNAIYGMLSTYRDVDYYRFTVKEKLDCHFYFEGVRAGQKVTLYEYNDPLIEIHTGGIYASFHYEWDETLTPGTYYFKFWGDSRLYPATGISYSISINASPVEREFDTFTLDAQNRNRYKTVLWEGDIKNKNNVAADNGKEKLSDGVQTLKKVTESYAFYIKNGTEKNGWYDPIFSVNQPSNINEKYLDSVLYIWDRQTLMALNAILKKEIIEVREQVKNERILSVKATFSENAIDGFNGVSSLLTEIACGASGVNTFTVYFHQDNPGEAIFEQIPVLGDIKKIFDIFKLANYEASVNTDDLDYFAMMGKIQQACEDAIRTNRVLRIPKYSYLVKETEDNRIIGCGKTITEWNLYKNCFVFDLDYEFLVDYDYTIFASQFNSQTNREEMGDIYPFVNYGEYEQYAKSGEYNENQLHPVLESINMTGYPRRVFELGEEFSSERLKVTANYNGSNSLVVDSYYLDASQVDTTKIGTYEVTIYYTEGNITKSTSYNVEVIWPRVIKNTPIQTIIRGEDLQFYTGHGTTRYEGHLSINLDENISQSWSDVILESFESNGELGIQDIRLDHNTFNNSLDLFVISSDNNGSANVTLNIRYYDDKDNQLEKIFVGGDFKTDFIEGESFSYEGLEITAVYTSLEACEVKNFTVDYSHVNMLYQGDYPVYVSYTENGITRDASYTVNVREPQAVSLSLRGDYQTVFEVGDEFSYEGLEAVIVRENGGTTPVTSSINVVADDVDMSTAGVYTVNVVYYTADLLFATSYDIEVKDKDPILKSITLSGSYATSFYVGDELSTEGLIVTAHYEYKEDTEVTNYEVTVPNMNTAGAKRVRISYAENGITKTAAYLIIVNEIPVPVTLESISLFGKYKTLFRVGQEFSATGLKVMAHYSDNTISPVTDFKVESIKVEMSTPGIYPVLVIYAEGGITVTTTYEVEVVGKLGPRDNTHF